MRPANRLLIVVFSVAIIVMYSILTIAQISIIRGDLYKALGDSTAYSAHQIASIVTNRIYEDYDAIKHYFDDDSIHTITCEELNCSDRRLVELKKVMSEEINQGEISIMGLVNRDENVLSIFNSLSLDDNSFLRYELDYTEALFENEVHLVTLSQLVKFTVPPASGSVLSKGVILYLNKYSENEYQFVARSSEYLNNFFTSLPLENERTIYLIGYNPLYTDEVAKSLNGTVYFSESDDNVTNFFDLIESSNGEVGLNKFIKYMNEKKYSTLMLGNVSTLICIEPFLDNSYFIYTTSLSQLNSTVSNLELTSTVIAIINAVIVVVLIFLIYRAILQRVSESHHSKTKNRAAKAFICEVDKQGNIKYANYTFEKSFRNYKPNINDYEFYEGSFNDAKENQEPFIIKDMARDGRTIYVSFTTLNKHRGYELIGYNVSKKVQDLQLMRKLAFVDDGTSLPNRQALFMDINRIINEIENQRGSLMVLNVLRFKDINSLFGYDFGNEVLTEIGKIIKKLLGDTGTVYRIENDKFGILLYDIESFAVSVDTAKRIIATLSQSITIKENEIKLQVKIGIFNIQKELIADLDSDAVINKAFLSADYVKDSNRFDYYIYDQNLELSALKDDIMTKDIAQALLNNEFDVHYQPQYSLKSNKIIGFEALLRWKNPKYASESPLKYIELAEKNGMINDIGNFVLHETFAFASYLKNTGVHISINISPVQLMQVGFLNEFLKIYEQYQLDNKSICIEITETYLINNFEEAVNKLKILSERGIHIHLDDFGSGYSSMQYIKNLPINAIKIDKEFTKALEYDKYSRAIVSRLLNLAKDLDLYAIVEGVETTAELNYLQKTTCDIIQGYLIGKAMPKQEAISLISNFNLTTKTTKSASNVKSKKKNV